MIVRQSVHNSGLDVTAAPGPAPAFGSDSIALLLRQLGIPWLAINPGASFRGLHDSVVNLLGNRDPGLILTLHEAQAVAIAHGYAKVTGRPMGVVLHANVGLMNAVMAIYNAWADRVPMLILGATGAVDAARRRPWIEWIHTSRDQAALVRPFLKWDDQPASVPAAVESLLRGWLMTRAEPQAPVYICLDVDLQERALCTARRSAARECRHRRGPCHPGARAPPIGARRSAPTRRGELAAPRGAGRVTRRGRDL